MKRKFLKYFLFLLAFCWFWKFSYLQAMEEEMGPTETVATVPEAAPPPVQAPPEEAAPTEEAEVPMPEIDAYKQEWSQIKTEIENIDQMESKVLELLRKLDNKLDEAIDESVNARKLSIEILKADKKTATENLKKLKKNLSKVKKIKNDISKFATELDENINQNK